MRYVRRELVITDVCDEEIKDVETIKSLFETMHKEQSDASIMYYSKPGEVPMAYERVRVSAVGEKSVDLQIFRGGSVLKARNIPFDQFVEVKVTSSRLDKFLKRNSGDRLRFLDTE